MHLANLRLFSLVLFFLLSITQIYSQSIKIKKTKKGYQYVDYHGNRLSKMYFEDAKDFRGIDSYAAVKLDGKWGYVNRDIEVVVEPKFDAADSFSQDVTIVRLDTSRYLINRSGTIISSPYDSLVQYSRDYVAILNGKYGLINKSDSILLKIDFENIGGKGKNRYLVKQNGKWGYFEDNIFTPVDKESIIFSRTDMPPIFSDECIGEKEIIKIKACSTNETLKTIYRNIRYPEEARAQKLEGTAVIGFEINKNGEIENPVIVRDIGLGCGEEALRVVTNYLNMWAKPAYLEGEPVRTAFNIPIKFRL